MDICRHESRFIHNIVEEVSSQVLTRTFLNVSKYPVGIESRVRIMNKLLGVGGNDVRMVGIWGTGGIGKTTIAKAVFNSISHKFEGRCFLANVREDSMTHGGLAQLQRVLLYEILGGKELNVNNVDRGINVIEERLSHKRVLLVLDDVTHLDQLNKLAGGLDWFGMGSRIIITTRDRHLLTAHGVHLIYKVKELNDDEALELFLSWNSFAQSQHLDDELELAKIIVNYAQGLPLALVVLGPLLRGRNKDEWESILDCYRRVPNQDIQEILKLSYDSLEDPVKEIFLDIACFFKGGKKNYVIQKLEGCGINPKYLLEVLIEKALITVDEINKIQMHDLIEEMGKEIVRQESPNEPGERSRLWFHEDVFHVLTENTGTNKIKKIMVKLAQPGEIRLNAKSFSNMKNLQLFISCNAHFSGEVDCLPNQLRVLDWPDCPFQSLPSNFNPRTLTELRMPSSRMSQLWEGFKSMGNLKSVNLESCKFLTKIPDFSGLSSLEELNLNFCTSLVEVHQSVGLLAKLKFLKLLLCSNLTNFPRRISLKCLESLNLKGCKRLENFPEIVGKMESLKKMILSGTAINELPSSIRLLTSLEELQLDECENLASLPCSIYELQLLKSISLDDCQKLLTFPIKVKPEVSWNTESHPSMLPTNSMILHNNHGNSSSESDFFWTASSESDYDGKLTLPKLCSLLVRDCNLSEIEFLANLDCLFTLEYLDLSRNNFVSLPECIRKFVNLQDLCLVGCTRLREIPELPPKVRQVNVGGCISLERFSKLSNILERKESQMISPVNLSNCRRLCDSLVHMAEKKYISSSDQAAFFSLFLSSQQTSFEIIFPGSEVPKWFSGRNDLSEQSGKCEVSVEIPQKWENKGLALWATFEETKNKSGDFIFLKAQIFINEEYIGRVLTRYSGDLETRSAHVWFYYIPSLSMIRKMKSCELPPYRCQVSFTGERSMAFKSCGIHLVMPQEGETKVYDDKSYDYFFPPTDKYILPN